jgi:hypothetical protein
VSSHATQWGHGTCINIEQFYQIKISGGILLYIIWQQT